ncbi:MAG: PQQ-binding-like beta-propeller repeat protein [Planctomyces sp.]
MSASENEDELMEITDDSSGYPDAAAEEELRKGRRQLSRGALAGLGDRITGGPSRPGEQEVIRSPMILGLGGTALGLALLAGLFYYIINREGESRRLQEAMTALEQKKYAEAELLFDRFLETYPKTEFSDTARLSRYKSVIEKHIMTTTPDVSSGLKELEALVRSGKDLKGFEAEREKIRFYADRLTFAGARVAEISQQQEPLDVSLRAMEILQRFAPESGVPADRLELLQRHQRIAEASILKRTAFESAVTGIREQLSAGQTIEALEARTQLLTRYPVLADDADVAKLLEEILNAEKQRIQPTDVDSVTATDAATANESGDVSAASLSLTLRTQATTDQGPSGRLVFAAADNIDSVTGIDAGNGSPVWRRVIGGGAAFAPMEVNGAKPALLVHSTIRNELQLLDRSTGQVLWARPMLHQPFGAPLIHQQRIYLSLQNGTLLEISAEDGRVESGLNFPQKVQGPPAISSDGDLMVIAGDAMVVYSLKFNPLSCTAVTFTEHPAGAVQTSLLAAGKLFVLCDNLDSTKCRVRAFTVDSASGQLKLRGQESVDGQVRDQCLLRGGELFVPSSPQRVTAFRVTDDAEQSVLTRIGANQLEDGRQTRMFLHAGSGGQLWLGGRSFRKFQIRTNGLLLDDGVAAEGIHLQPIQAVDGGVFLTSREPSLSSVFFTRADPVEMKGLWRTVVSTNVVAIGAGQKGTVAVSDFGEVFQFTDEQLSAGGFVTDSVSQYRLPDKLSSSVFGLSLLDGRFGVWCGAPEPSLWTIMPTGLLERKWSLTGAPEAAVAIDAGVVFCLPGKIHLTATRGGQSVDDYQLAQDGSEPRPWKSLAAISGDQVVAVSSRNELIRIQYRTKPRPQLSEISITEMRHELDLAPAVGSGVICFAASDGHLLILDAETLAVRADTDLGGVPVRSPLISGNRIFVETADHRIRVYAVDRGFAMCGEFDAGEQGGLVDAPMLLSDGAFVAARAGGQVCRMTPDGVPEADLLKLSLRLVRGPVKCGQSVIVVAADGTIHRLSEDLLK